MRRKHIVVMIIFCIIMLGGCSQNKEEEQKVALGRYKEEELVLPDSNINIIGIDQSDSGTIQIYAYTGGEKKKKIKGYVYKYENGQWNKEELNWITKAAGSIESGILQQYIKGEDGKEYVLAFDYTTDKNGESHIFCLSNGTVEELTISDLKEKSGIWNLKPYIDKIAVLADGTIATKNQYDYEEMGGILYQPKQYKKDTLDLLPNYIAKEQMLYGINKKQSSVICQLGDGSEKEYETQQDLSDSIIGIQKDTIYILNKTGIYRMEEKGSLWQNVVDGDWTNLCNPSFSPEYFYITNIELSNADQEEYYVVGSTNNTLTIYRYYFDETAKAVPEKELKVYSIKDNPTIHQAIAHFQKKYPDIKVIYRTAQEQGKITDSIRALNTELLAGEGADVLLLDGLDINSYIEKGVLKDLSSLITTLSEKEPYLSNIIECFQKENSFYTIPMRFNVPILYGEKQIIEQRLNMEGLCKWMKENKTKKVLPTTTAQNLMELFFYLNQEKFVTETDITNFLENMNRIIQNVGIDEELQNYVNYHENNNNGNFIMLDSVFELQSMELGKKVVQNVSQLDSLFKASIPFYHIREKQFQYCDIDGLFIPVGVIGINAATKEEELSKKFIEEALSFETQKVILEDGFPINEKAFQYVTGKSIYSKMLGSIVSDTGEIIELPALSKQEVEGIKSLVTMVNKPLSYDMIQKEMIIEELIAWYSTDRTKENCVQTAKNIAQKINLYQKER